MSRNIIIVKEDTSINDLIRIFVEHKISCVPVVNDKEKLVGIATKTDVLGYFLDIDLHISVKEALRDVLEYGAEQSDREEPPEKEMNVGAIMTPDPITAHEDTPVETLARTMIENNIHRLIIMGNGTITGIVSTLDILYHVAGVEKKERKK